MELNINRDIIKWNKLWAKDNQYTSICCLQAQKKLIWIDNVSDLTFPSSATTMMMMLTCVSMFICLKNLCQSPNYCGWCHLPCAVGQCVKLCPWWASGQSGPIWKLRLTGLRSSSHRGGHNNRRQKKYILQNKYKALGAKIASALELAYVV